MNSALRINVCLSLTGLFIFTCSYNVTAKTGKDHATSASAENTAPTASHTNFKWNEHNKLSWEDFRGPVNAVTDESAAATNCGIGFRTATGADGKPRIIVYNTFYTGKSWVRPDARLTSILDHEQGHFDLCEIYTRILRERMSNISFDKPDMQSVLMSVYNGLQDEYENRQQSYERETIHGTNLDIQKKWNESITRELAFAKN